MNKPWLKTGLKVLVAISLLSWFLYHSDIDKIFENLSSLSPRVLAAAIILSLIYQVIKSFRWWLLLTQYSFFKLIKLNLISQFYSLFSVGQFVGEGAKIYILGKGQKEAGRIAMSVLIDKITGMIGQVIVAIFGLAFTKTILPKSLTWTFIAAAILCLFLIFLIRLKFVYNFLSKILSDWSAVAIKLRRFVGWAIRLLEAWHSYSKKIKIIFVCIVLSMVFQLVLAGVYMILSHGLGINILFLDWCWILGILAGFLVLPITVGGLGVREGSLVGLLGIFMIAPEQALALSFSFFGVQLVLAVIGGMIEAQRIKMFKIGLPNKSLNI
ncbi:MAG: lysylphosphatidylglycerol synthase transmembrane domain-containing protein [Patescibacteria group bacterium]|nr:lysylphosphatidylglycerol synthase transmembrane domain-containing protein [Patescibacteria group bacterium]